MCTLPLSASAGIAPAKKVITRSVQISVGLPDSAPPREGSGDLSMAKVLISVSGGNVDNWFNYFLVT